MADDISISINGNPEGFKKSMQDAIAAAKSGADNIGNSFTPLKNVFEGLNGQIAAVASVLAGGAIFREMVAHTVDFTKESIKLGRALGESATDASVLRVALEANRISQEEFIGSAQKLDKQVRTNEQGLNAMGLATRDSGGKLKSQTDLMLDAIEVLNSYKQGTDRNIAGQVLFGKGFESTTNLVNLNKESLKEFEALQRSLGSIVGQENVEAFQAYHDAEDKAMITMDAMKQVIGNALLPVLTELADWFTSTGPTAVAIIKDAFGGIVSIFHVMTMSATVFFETVNALAVSVIEPISAMGMAIKHALSGDWDAAANRMATVAPTVKSAWNSAFEDIQKKGAETRDKISALFGLPTDSKPAEKGGKSAEGLIKTNESSSIKPEKDTSQMQYYESVLDNEKRLAYEKDALLGYSKQQELAYWQTLLNSANLSAKDRLAIEIKTSNLIVEIKKKEAKQIQELDTEDVRHREVTALNVIAAEKAAAKASVDVGTMTKMDFLNLEKDYENRSYAIKVSALQAKLEIIAKDPLTNPTEYARIKNQILELEQENQIKITNISGERMKEASRGFADFGNRVSSLWNKGLQAMLNGTLTWSNAWRAILTDMTAWFITDVIGQQIKVWVSAESMKIAMKLGFIAEEKAATIAGSAMTVAAKTEESISVVTANAAEAASGAAAAEASIPYVGPALAVAAAGAMLGFVMGLLTTKSAAGGYDIPRGVNPMVQVHSEEMILPAELSNKIRGMTSGQTANESSISNQSINVHISAIDSESVRKLFLRNKDHLVKAISEATRNGQMMGLA